MYKDKHFSSDTTSIAVSLHVWFSSAGQVLFQLLHHMKLHVHWCSVKFTPRIQEPLWSVFPFLSAISINDVIKDRCLARFERVVKMGGRNNGKMNIWLEVSFFHSVIARLENIYSASAPTFSSSQLHMWNFSSFHWSVRSWAGATRSQYGPSPLRRSEPFQVQESNT